MPGLNLTVVGLFVLSVSLVIGIGLFVLATVLRARARHRRRLARVGRRRMSGRLDMEEARLSLLRHKQESNALVGLSNALARFVPLFNTTRLRANISRAGMSLSVGAFVLLSLVAAGLLAVAGTMATGYPLPLLIIPSALTGMFLVDAFVKMRGDMKAAEFMRQLPDALDTIIRGIRSGLPVIECVGTVGQEYDEPLGAYFRGVIPNPAD